MIGSDALEAFLAEKAGPAPAPAPTSDLPPAALFHTSGYEGGGHREGCMVPGCEAQCYPTGVVDWRLHYRAMHPERLLPKDRGVMSI